jgi:hypothetical protein
VSGTGHGKNNSGLLLKVTKPAATATSANVATCEFPRAHPQNHHPDEKVVNPQFFAQLVFAGCKPFFSSKTQQKSALQAA